MTGGSSSQWVQHDGRTDSEIINQSLEHPQEFGRIYSRHYEAVFAFVARRVGPSDAGDLTADVFLRAFTIRHRYDRSKANSLPWLYGIASNVLGDRSRQLKRQSASLLPRQLETGSHEWQSDDRLVAAAVRDRLEKALRLLPRKDREALTLFAVEGLTYREIAEVLHIPTGTVGSRVSRARQRILESVPDLRQITDRERIDDEEGM